MSSVNRPKDSYQSSNFIARLRAGFVSFFKSLALAFVRLGRLCKQLFSITVSLITRTMKIARKSKKNSANIPPSKAPDIPTDQTTLEKASGVNNHNSQHRGIQMSSDLIASGASMLPDENRIETVKSQRLGRFISLLKISEKEAFALSSEQVSILENTIIQDAICAGALTVREALAFSEELIETLENRIILNAVSDNRLTAEVVFRFEWYHHAALKSATILGLIDNNLLSAEQIPGFSLFHQRSFENENIQNLLRDEILTVEHVLAFRGWYHRFAFSEERVQDLIRDNTITVQEIILLPESHVNTLLGPETLVRFANGALTFEDFLEEQRDAPVVINARQSTHNAAVHQSVSVSATKLQERYGAEIEGTGLDVITNRVSTYLEGLDDSRVNAAAKRGMQRITAPDYIFEDPGSGVSIRALLALSFLAIEDAGQRMGTLEDARAQFVHGFYEIQRGYNLNSANQDDNEPDKSICTAGTFNKLIEKLEGVHPDCNIRFMTQETAALKLPIVVQEEAVRYLSGLANPQSHADFLAFTRLMSELEEEGAGADAIYEDIKDSVSLRMYEEFGSLYRGESDAAFTGLIDAGEDTELKNLNQFQAQLEDSEGYRLSHLEKPPQDRQFLPCYRRTEQPDTISSEVQPSSQESIMSDMQPLEELCASASTGRQDKPRGHG